MCVICCIDIQFDQCQVSVARVLLILSFILSLHRSKVLFFFMCSGMVRLFMGFYCFLRYVEGILEFSERSKFFFSLLLLMCLFFFFFFATENMIKYNGKNKGIFGITKFGTF